MLVAGGIGDAVERLRDIARGRNSQREQIRDELLIKESEEESWVSTTHSCPRKATMSTSTATASTSAATQPNLTGAAAPPAANDPPKQPHPLDGLSPTDLRIKLEQSRKDLRGMLEKKRKIDRDLVSSGCSSPSPSTDEGVLLDRDATGGRVDTLSVTNELHTSGSTRATTEQEVLTVSTRPLLLLRLPSKHPSTPSKAPTSPTRSSRPLPPLSPRLPPPHSSATSFAATTRTSRRRVARLEIARGAGGLVTTRPRRRECSVRAVRHISGSVCAF